MTSEWKTSPLRNLVGFISKGIAPSYADEESETTVRVLNQKCNRNFRINYSESRLHDLARKKVPVERFVREDDILINSTGAGTAGRIAQIGNLPCDTIVDGHIHSLSLQSQCAESVPPDARTGDSIPPAAILCGTPTRIDGRTGSTGEET